MNIELQQLHSGFKSLSHHGAPLPVLVHEALDAQFQKEPCRYFVTVDGKWRRCDALNIGQPGWHGMTRAEATREAKWLAARINSVCAALESAKENALKWDTSSNRLTVQVQEAALARITDKYCAEITPL